jgi:chemotaxis protein methyltransferase WspC
MAQSEIANLLKLTIGVDAATIGQSVIDHAIRARMAACRLTDLTEYREWLRCSEAELQALIEAVVVPETWFFRDEETFSALVHFVMDDWVPAHPVGVLRILSAPCSSGEEPYSISMALLDAGLPPRRFTIDALDISVSALAQAKRTLFGKNAFRGGDLAFRERHFRQTPKGYELAQSVAGQVHYQRGNLIDADLLAGAEGYDFIFCRNVLIYFDRATQERVIRSLDRLLAVDGILFVGPAEAFLTRCSGFSGANHPRAFACRKAAAKKAAPPAEPPPEKPRSATVRRASPPPKRIQKPVSKAAVPAPSPPADLEAAQRLADAGRLGEARTVCEALLKEHGASASAYFLLGLVRDGMGDHREASDCYRKVLYLEPNHPEALLHLALLAEKQGDPASARRLQIRARRVEEAAKR